MLHATLRCRACLAGAMAWACLPGNQSQPQATEIQRLGRFLASELRSIQTASKNAGSGGRSDPRPNGWHLRLGFITSVRQLARASELLMHE